MATHQHDSGRGPEFWRNVARQTLRRAEEAVDPRVQQLLRSQAQDYMRRAAEAARRPDKEGT